MLFVSCVCHAVTSVHSCLVVTCWERADLLALVVMSNFDCVTFSCGILGQVWYLIVLIPDLCRLSYFVCYSVFHFRHNFISPQYLENSRIEFDHLMCVLILTSSRLRLLSVIIFYL